MNDDSRILYEFIKTIIDKFEITIPRHNFLDYIVRTVKYNKNEYTEKKDIISKMHNKRSLPLQYIYAYEKGIHNNLRDFIKDSRDDTIKLNKKLVSYKDHTKKSKTIYQIMYKIEGTRKELHNILYNNPFVSLDTQFHAETSELVLYTVTVKKDKNDDEELSFKIYMHKESKVDFNLVICICKFMREIAIKYKSKIMKYPGLVIFAGLQKKLVTTYDTMLCAENINSGSTYVGESVSIWRNEEIYKVLIHELIHYYGIDFYISSENYGKIEEYVDKNFCKTDGSFDRPNESYTETLAILIHTALMSKLLNLDYYEMLKYEICFSLFQVSKIVKYFGFKKFEEIFNIKKCNNFINQRTSVISYFIIKTSLLMSLNEFMDFVVKHNLIIEENIIEYKRLIEKTLWNEKFITSVNKMMLMDSENNIVNNCLRMSLFQPK